MIRHAVLLTFTFVNPNTTEAFEAHLRKIIIDKLLTKSMVGKIVLDDKKRGNEM